MKIKQHQLRAKERNWLNHLLAKDFLYRAQLIGQIEHANLSREYTAYYISLRFAVEPNTPKINIQVRVSLEMSAFFPRETPIQFLLHIKNGFVHALEIFKADSTQINPHFNLKKAANITYIFDDEIKLS